jgi:hypothetical protein
MSFYQLLFDHMYVIIDATGSIRRFIPATQASFTGSDLILAYVNDFYTSTRFFGTIQKRRHNFLRITPAHPGTAVKGYNVHKILGSMPLSFNHFIYI